MRSFTIALPLLVAVACSGGSDDKAGDSGITNTGDDDDVTGDDDDDVPGDDDDDDDDTVTATHTCHDTPMALSVGTGLDMFEPLNPSDEITVVHGPQGGWHIDIGGEVTGTTDLVEVSSTITVVSTGDVIAGDQQPTRIALFGWDESSCTGTFFGITTYVDDIPSTDQEFVCGLEAETLEIELTVTDLSAPSKTITETLEVTMALDPVDEKPCAAI